MPAARAGSLRRRMVSRRGPAPGDGGRGRAGRAADALTVRRGSRWRLSRPASATSPRSDAGSPLPGQDLGLEAPASGPRRGRPDRRASRPPPLSGAARPALPAGIRQHRFRRVQPRRHLIARSRCARPGCARASRPGSPAPPAGGGGTADRARGRPSTQAGSTPVVVWWRMMPRARMSAAAERGSPNGLYGSPASPGRARRSRSRPPSPIPLR